MKITKDINYNNDNYRVMMEINKIELYKFKEYIKNTNKSTIFQHTGFVGTFCPACYNPIIFNRDVSYQCKTTSNIVEPAGDLSTLEYYIKCQRCGNEEYVSIILDPNITEAIARLNLKNYKTKTSCEGHLIHGINKVCEAYVSFSDFNMIKILKNYPLPEPWIVDMCDVKNREFIIRVPYTNKAYTSDDELFKRINALNQWSISLP